MRVIHRLKIVNNSILHVHPAKSDRVHGLVHKNLPSICAYCVPCVPYFLLKFIKKYIYRETVHIYPFFGDS